MRTNIEVFYTGGGIYLAEADIDKEHYAVVSTEAPDCLAVYAYDDGEKTYYPEDMTVCANKEDIPPELKDLYAEMAAKLKTA